MLSIPVFLSSDDNYAPYVATIIASIADNTKAFVDFYILDGGITVKNKEKIDALKEKFNNFSTEYIKVDIQKEFDFLKHTIENKKLTLAALSRILIPQLKSEIKKAIYLDVDIIAFQDIAQLYEIDLSGYAIGAVEDQGGDSLLKMLKNDIDINLDSIYFNSGVLLIDCEKWRKDNIKEKLFKIAKQIPNNTDCDQGILNKYFFNNYKILDKKFNVMFESGEVVLRHYSGIVKPWQADFNFNLVTRKPQKMNNTAEFLKYAKMTEFYDEILKNRENFLNSNALYKRFNKMAQEGKI